MSNRMPVLTATLSAALSARTGILTRALVDQLQIWATNLLDERDELRPAIRTFVAAYRRDHRDPEAMAAHGATLEAELDEILKLTPSQPRTRADIDG